MNEDLQHELVTIGEAHRRTGLGRRQFYNAIENGELSVFDVGWPRLRWSQVVAWLEGRRRVPARETQQGGADRA